MEHPLRRILPLGRKMTRPTPVVIRDRDGGRHECLAEAFDTTYNVLILLYPVKALSASTVIMPVESSIAVQNCPVKGDGRAVAMGRHKSFEVRPMQIARRTLRRKLFRL